MYATATARTSPEPKDIIEHEHANSNLSSAHTTYAQHTAYSYSYYTDTVTVAKP